MCFAMPMALKTAFPPFLHTKYQCKTAAKVLTSKVARLLARIWFGKEIHVQSSLDGSICLEH